MYFRWMWRQQEIQCMLNSWPIFRTHELASRRRGFHVRSVWWLGEKACDRNAGLSTSGCFPVSCFVACPSFVFSTVLVFSFISCLPPCFSFWFVFPHSPTFFRSFSFPLFFPYRCPVGCIVVFSSLSHSLFFSSLSLFFFFNCTHTIQRNLISHWR